MKRSRSTRCSAVTRAHARVLLDTLPLVTGSFRAMAERTVQLVLHYDGARFSGWQRQPEQRTVQGVVEQALERLCGGPIPALGSGRTDAGVHARGQAVGVRVPERWDAARVRRALNAILPDDVWVAAALEMRPEFHARYSAVSRRYSYYVGTDDEARSPFRRPRELRLQQPLGSGDARPVRRRSSRASIAFGASPYSERRPPTTTIAVSCARLAGAIGRVGWSSRSKPIGFFITWCDFSSERCSTSRVDDGHSTT